MSRRRVPPTLSLFAAAALVLAGTTSASAAVTTVSAVDFEDGTTGAWLPSGGDADTLAVIEADGGGRMLEIADRNADYVGIQSPAGIFAAGKTYTLAMRVRLAEGTPDTSVRFVMKPTYTWIGNTTVTAAAWTTVSGQFTVPTEGDVSGLQAYVGTSDIAGTAAYTYYVDDIVVTTEDGPGGDPVPDVPPGGAQNPVPTPVTAAQGSGNVAALTFDDGPNPGTTPALLDFLRENDIRAVFCVIGQNIQAPGGADLLRRIVAEGHVLCNHSTTYDDMGGLTQQQAAQRMAENLTIIRTALGDPDAPVPFFRAPNGSWGNTQAAAVSLGMQPLAVVNTIQDWETQDEATLTANLRSAMKPGQFVLTHDGGGDRSGTLAAVRTVVGERLADGWTFVLPVGVPAPLPTSDLSTGFEDGLDGWGPRDSGSGAPVVALTGQAHSGSQAAAVTGRTSQGSGIGHDIASLQPGTTYEVSAWVRFAAGQPTSPVWLSLARTLEGSTTYSTIGQFTGITDTDWTQVSATLPMTAFDSGLLYFETDYNATNTSDFFIDDISVTVPPPTTVQDLEPIKDTVEFPVGVAIDSRETSGAASDLLQRHFDQVTSENYMKPEAWYAADRTFRADPEAIALMDYAAAHDLRVYGHTLVWHSQTPGWFFEDAAGRALTDSPADQQLLRERMREHIFAVAGWLSNQYGAFGSDTNPLVAFDVVNEVVSDASDTADGLRVSRWREILGEEYIDLAFRYADEAFNDTYAEPGAGRPVTLFINDYNTEQSGKQMRLHDLVERLLARGAPVDGVGHQFHVSLAMPVTALSGALDAFADLGVTQAVTELDVTTGTPVSEASLIEQGYYFRDAFRAFRARADDLFSVTVWGLTDGRSWRSSSGAPLVFDDALQAKPAYYGIVDEELPARLRTGNAFRGEVAVTPDAAQSPEWQKLPLFAIDESRAFQLRWETDHLSVYATVDDDTVQAEDAVEFAYGTQSVRIPRAGAEGAAVAEREGGYTVVAHLPLATAATEGSTIPLDVRVTDGASTVAWNTPGSTGTITLLEPLSYLEVPRAVGVPVIDGMPDAGWDAAAVVETGKQVQGSAGATAQVRTLWDDDTLYVRMDVVDPLVDVSGSDPWIQDSVEIFVDPGNVKNGSYRYDDMQLRISATNVLSFGTGDEAFQRARVQSAVVPTADGYRVEAAIGLGDVGGEGTYHGVDFQVNDAEAGARTGIRNWADPSGAGYQSTSRWGVAQLVAAPAAPVDPSDPGTSDPDPTVVPLAVEQGTSGAGSSDPLAATGATAPWAIVLLGFVLAGAGVLLRIRRVKARRR